jgi:hypothetical protein
MPRCYCERPVLVVEAAPARPVFGGGVAQVPFADDHDFISGFLQRLRQQPFVGRKPYLWLDGMIAFWNP